MKTLEIKDEHSLLLYYDFEIFPKDLKEHLLNLINEILFRTVSYKQNLEDLQRTWGFWDNEEDREYDYL